MADDLLPLLGINLLNNGGNDEDSSSDDDDNELEEEDIDIEVDEEEDKNNNEEMRSKEKKQRGSMTFDTSLPGTHSVRNFFCSTIHKTYLENVYFFGYGV